MGHKLTTNPGTPLPHLAFKNALLKSVGELVPCNEPCTFLHHNLVSAEWLTAYGDVGELTQVWFGNKMSAER